MYGDSSQKIKFRSHGYKVCLDPCNIEVCCSVHRKQNHYKAKLTIKSEKSSWWFINASWNYFILFSHCMSVALPDKMYFLVGTNQLHLFLVFLKFLLINIRCQIQIENNVNCINNICIIFLNSSIVNTIQIMKSAKNG